MPTCFQCKNDFESGAEDFLPSSCGKCDVCLENCPVPQVGTGAVYDVDQGAMLHGQSIEKFSLMCDHQDYIESDIQNEAAIRGLVKADCASEFAKSQAVEDKRFGTREFGTFTGLKSTPGVSVKPGSFSYM